jgi:glutamine amidotransferase
VGGVSLKNTHPFVRGQWLFAHNGTVEGFAENPGPLLQLIPEHLGGEIEGETDSEHLFYALLGRLEGIGQPTEDELTSALTDLILEVVRRYPGSSQEPTRLNVVLTNGEVLLASRWGHSLYSSRVGGTGGDRFIDVADGSGTVNGFAISSEPVTPDGWEEVPDRTLIVGRQDGTSSFKPIRQTPPNG